MITLKRTNVFMMIERKVGVSAPTRCIVEARMKHAKSNEAGIQNVRLWHLADITKSPIDSRFCPQANLALLRDLLARSAELSGKIFHLRESVPHGQNSLGVIDVDARAKLQRRQCGGKHIDQC
jgi:hypothetical protein